MFNLAAYSHHMLEQQYMGNSGMGRYLSSLSHV